MIKIRVSGTPSEARDATSRIKAAYPDADINVSQEYRNRGGQTIRIYIDISSSTHHIEGAAQK